MKYSRIMVQKWIDALRSGEYTQTRRSLQDKKGHCCLGVACELFIPKSEQVRGTTGFLKGGYPSDQKGVAPTWLNDELDYSIVRDFENFTGVELITLNDEGLGFGEDLPPLTFDEIADLLQAVYIEDALG